MNVLVLKIITISRYNKNKNFSEFFKVISKYIKINKQAYMKKCLTNFVVIYLFFKLIIRINVRFKFNDDE